MRKPGEHPSIATPLLAMLALIAAISVATLLIFRAYDREHRVHAQDLVTAVAQQKAQALEIWLDGRVTVTTSLRMAPALREAAEQLVTRRDAGILPRIRQILDLKRWGNQSALLLDVHGAPLVAVGAPDHVSAELRARARAAAASGETQLHFLHRDEDLPGSPVFLDYLAPLTAPEGKGKPIAVLVLRHDPEQFFFPLIQTWPAPSTTAETMLVRAEGGKVLTSTTGSATPPTPRSG